MNSKWGWHLLQPDRRLGFKDKRPVPLGVRMEMQYRSEQTERIIKTRINPRLCCQGMHASARVLDALRYPYTHRNLVLCRVLVEEDIVSDGMKFVGRYRTVTGWADFEDIARKVLIDFFAKAGNKSISEDLARYFKTGEKVTQGRVPTEGLIWQLVLDVMRDGPAVGLKNLNYSTSDKRCRVSLAWIDGRITHYAKEAGITLEEEGGKA